MSEENGAVRIVLAGAGHCHAEILRRSRALTSRGYGVTVISPDEEHAYSGMAPGLLAGSWSGEESSLKVAALARRGGVQFLQDRVTGVDPIEKTVLCKGHPPQRYDILSVNLGSETVLSSSTIPATSATRRVWPSKPVRSLMDAAGMLQDVCRDAWNASIEVAVIGGGFGGVELASNTAAFLKDRGNVTIYTWRLAPSLASHPRRMRYVRRILNRRGVVVREGVRVDPEEISADIVIVATGITPPAVLQNFGIPLGKDGALPVDRYLRVSGAEDVFAVGDCADFLPEPLKRLGVFAVRQQPVLLHNLLVRAATLASRYEWSIPKELKPFTDTGPYLQGMNLGPGKGMLFRRWWTLTGVPAWHLKAFIDRRFVGRYRE